MTEKKTRRGRGEGGLWWDEAKQRFVCEITIGYTPAGKRIVRRGSGKTKTEARAKLKTVLKEHEAGLLAAPAQLTVGDAVNDWLTYGLVGLGASTVTKISTLCRKNLVPALGPRKLRELKTVEVDKWLLGLAANLSTRTVQDLHSFLNRAVDRAMAHDRVARNVVALATIPTGQQGRTSKSLRLDQAEAVIAASIDSWLHAYVVLSLLIGARTEELRALTWDHVDLVGHDTANPPVPPSISVWRSVRVDGDTKTRKSRRTLALPRLCVAVLHDHRSRQLVTKERAGNRWRDANLVFCTKLGTPLLAGNVRRAFRSITEKAGLDPDQWTPRELRHSFVSLLSDHGVSLEQIADLVGHAGTSVTEKVYRHQLRPVLRHGATAMDEIFGGRQPDSG